MSAKDGAGRFAESVHRVIVGQDEIIRLAFMALALRGHILIEGVPGTAKTLLARTVARLVGGSFKRVQFTPDLMPATQNPVEYGGTYPLPEAELDRFLFKAVVPYPQPTEEAAILRRHDKGRPLDVVEQLAPLPDGELVAARDEIDNVTVEDSVVDYVVRIVEETRRSGDLLLGASPRAGVHLLRAAKANAALEGRDFVTPDDVKSLVPPTLQFAPSTVEIVTARHAT